MIKVALPNKGTLFEPTIELMSACGYRVLRAAGLLSAVDPDNDVEFYWLRPGDIPLYVANGLLDAGITGKDFVAEKGVAPAQLVELNYGHSRLCAAVPEESPVKTLDDVVGLTIATSFPGITAQRFTGQQLKLVQLEGAVEIAVRLGIADAVVDVVDTGNTLRQAGLRVVGEPLFRSNAAFFTHPGRQAHEQVTIMKNRIEGKIVAQDWMMVEYDVPAAILGAACEITPGIESPTITPLQNEGWYSVKAMVRRREAHRIMDELSRAGCKGILLTTIESARI
ncbi:MAG TPA: ATP phosphoribosyltransferase [Tepidiformaceae bacterium]|nr:ATP phosphoribosyltransferase [Tepidiformaceae bacterium]